MGAQTSAVTTWTLRTDVFDGPMDLLLYLVRRDGLDLAAFPVRQVTDAYLSYLDRMRELHLGIAGEYLVMAATLCWLKSLEILPRPPTALDEEEEGEDPREALVRRLREYQRFRDAADELEVRVRIGRDTFVREPRPVPVEDRPVYSPVDAFGLLEVYAELLERGGASESDILIDGSGPDVFACCERVLARIERCGGTVDLGEVLRELPRTEERVVTFVGVLEMGRLGWLRIEQRAHLEPVLVSVKEGAEVDLHALSGVLVEEAAG